VPLVSTRNGLLVALLVQFIGTNAAYIWSWRRTRPFGVHPTTIREADLSPEEPSFGHWGNCLPLIPLLLAGLYLQHHWDEIPSPFPTHWDISGQPNRWAQRSVRDVYMPLATGGGLLFIMMLIRWALVSGARRGPALRPALRIVTAIMWILAGTFSTMALLPVYTGGSGTQIPIWIACATIMATVGCVIWFALSSNWAASAAEVTPDDCWRLGAFYYNPQDPALMVQRRFGLGYTLNFANPKAWVLLAMMLGLLILLPISMKLLR
jgi:uncharacterized membrane protein